MRRWQQYHRPPRALRNAQLDNIAIVPASLLPQKARYQALANQLPAGDILVIMPQSTASQRVLHTVAALFRHNGHHVHTLHVQQRTTPV